METANDLKQALNRSDVGPALAIYFDVVSVKLLGDNEIKDSDIDASTNTVTFHEMTMDKIPYKVVRPISDIQGIVYAEKGYTRLDYDMTRIR